MREHILQVCNTRLSECAAKEKEDREKHTAAGTMYEHKGSAFVSTFGILRESPARQLYAWRRAILIRSIFVETLCLNYQMELLHYHVGQARVRFANGHRLTSCVDSGHANQQYTNSMARHASHHVVERQAVSRNQESSFKQSSSTSSSLPTGSAI